MLSRGTYKKLTLGCLSTDAIAGRDEVDAKHFGEPDARISSSTTEAKRCPVAPLPCIR